MHDIEQLTTARLILRRPRPDDADAIFSRYASDVAVTRFVGWPRHRTVEDSHAFVRISDGLWERWGAGPYLVVARANGDLLGCAGLVFETPEQAMAGYVFAVDAWGHGYATESLEALVDVTTRLGVRRLYALCHTEHEASSRVLDKCAFTHEGTWPEYAEFPNLTPGVRLDVSCYARSLP